MLCNFVFHIYAFVDNVCMQTVHVLACLCSQSLTFVSKRQIKHCVQCYVINYAHIVQYEVGKATSVVETSKLANPSSYSSVTRFFMKCQIFKLNVFLEKTTFHTKQIRISCLHITETTHYCTLRSIFFCNLPQTRKGLTTPCPSRLQFEEFYPTESWLQLAYKFSFLSNTGSYRWLLFASILCRRRLLWGTELSK